MAAKLQWRRERAERNLRKFEENLEEYRRKMEAWCERVEEPLQKRVKRLLTGRKKI